MIKCSSCGKRIAPKTRIIIGPKGGTYHVSCSRLKNRHYGYTK